MPTDNIGKYLDPEGYQFFSKGALPPHHPEIITDSHAYYTRNHRHIRYIP